MSIDRYETGRQADRQNVIISLERRRVVVVVVVVRSPPPKIPPPSVFFGWREGYSWMVGINQASWLVFFEGR